MTKPNTLQDLHAQGLVTNGDVDRIARRFFTEMIGYEIVNVIEGYNVRPPNFDDLPDACKQFIRKALLFSTVVNTLDADIADAIAEQDSFDEAEFYSEDPEDHA